MRGNDEGGGGMGEEDFQSLIPPKTSGVFLWAIWEEKWDVVTE